MKYRLGELLRDNQPMTIGLLGRKGSGKNEVSRILVERMGFYETSCAKKLYKEVAEAFGVSVAFLNNRDTKETPLPELALSCCRENDPFWSIAWQVLMAEHSGKLPASGWFINPVTRDFILSPRKVLQLWGTEYRRAQDNYYWVKALDEDIKGQSNKRVVVFDIREHHEAAYVKRRDNGEVWKLERLDNPYAFVGSSKHSSETTVDSVAFDRVVPNNDTLAALDDYVTAMFLAP